MPKFAIYYVPPAEDEFYRLGTQILGYDVRVGKSVELTDDLRNLLRSFDKQWIEDAQPYGFHLTISDAINFERRIEDIERETVAILNCFNPNHHFQLKSRNDDFVTFWRTKKGWAVVLRYDPNDHLKILHALVVSRTHPLGVGSGYLERYNADPSQYKNRRYQAHRIRKFYSPTVFDSYSPHFTLLNPYTGNDHDRLTRIFSKIFREFSCITLDTICLLIQRKKDENWEIHKEFKLKFFPTPL